MPPYRLPAIFIVLALGAFIGPVVMVSSTKPDCPEVCPECPKVDCPRTVVDECGCCQVCLRSVGESCGSWSLGVCEKNLQCIQNTDKEDNGICTEMSSSSSCLSANCSVVFHPRCPSDSRLLILPPPKGECCGKPGTCVCDLQKCADDVPICDDELLRVLVEEAGAEPGRCCDKYECRRKENHCANVRCPSVILDGRGESVNDEDCPDDSIRPATHITPGSCCPIIPGCKCRAAVCRPAVCPEGKKVKLLRKGNGTPGKCCDLWDCEDVEVPMGKNCTWGDKMYSDGQEWHSSSCEVCKCKKGVAQCSKMTCPKPPSQCTWIGVLPGECCPICIGCQTEKMEKKKKNETWHRDDCTTCTCSEDGAPVCEKAMCSVQCENPKKVEGQCCPVCDEPTILSLPSTCPSLEHCPLRCENGLKRDDQGCFQCECLPSSRPIGEECPQLSKDNCEKQCAHGYLKDGSGCVVCRCAKCPPLHQCTKHCLYGFESNALGCPVCKCKARINAKLTISDRLDSLSGKDKCGALSISGKLVERDGGEWWNDGCRHCFCEHKQEYCSLISCPERPDSCSEENWIHKEGHCCPSCSSEPVTPQSIISKHEHTICQSPGTGRLFTDGETWQLAPCVSCTCRVGHVLCRTESCPPVACPHPIQDKKNHCCSKCESDDSSSSSFLKGDPSTVCTDDMGIAHVSGESWRTDDCTSCTCSPEGVIECFRESCSSLSECKGKELVIKGRCCPVCSDVLQSDSVCAYSSAVYSLHEEWRDGACRNCSCVQGGQTVCREAVCPPCSDPVPIQGQCCPLCKDSGGWAAFGGGSPSSDHVSLLPPSNSSSNNSSALGVIGLSFCAFSLIILLFVIVFILYRRRTNQREAQKPSTKVQLSSCKTHGSIPNLAEFEKRRRDTDDGQSESLLSTTSESSAGMSQSSGHSDTHLLYKSSKYHV